MPLLSVDNVTKTFGGLTAVNRVTYHVDTGEVVGLIGPNGAGKTTCFNLITGNYTPDQGTIRFADADITGLQPNRIVRAGIARTFQSIRLFSSMTALENVLAGCHCRMNAGLLSAMFRTPGQKQEEAAALARALGEIDFVGLGAFTETDAVNLSYGNQRLLEIARALASEPRLLILDEPAGGMNDQETEALVTLIEAIRKRGITVFLIEHDMSLVMKACDRIVVLEYGSKIAEGAPEDIKTHPRVIEAYLGTDED
ncbi:MAG: ABC transporter ATP-binding protein [Deltaproteobacteria bacterium]|nr:MAG: ABC transporter ATP-binding protein [Deltaproteobacteria bacterium]